MGSYIEQLSDELHSSEEKLILSNIMDGNLDGLKSACENGFKLTVDVCNAAVASGNLECLKYAHEHKCPWNEGVPMNAARNGELECLKYLYENGCPWNVSVCIYASQNNYLECLKYGFDNGAAKIEINDVMFYEPQILKRSSTAKFKFEKKFKLNVNTRWKYLR